MSNINFFKRNKFLYWIYKIQKIYKNKKPNFHYAEFAEDIMVNRILKNFNKGFYLDVGAYHPYKGSLTRSLFKRGWRGMNLDISKSSIDLFNLARPHDININCAVSNFNGETNYYENSPINQQNSLIKSNEQQLKVKIKCFTLNSILKQNNINSFDYLNIDVEGSEMEVIKGIDFDKFNPRLITIENNDLLLEDYSRSEVYELLIKSGYTLINKIGVTNFFIKNEIKGKISELIKI